MLSRIFRASDALPTRLAFQAFQFVASLAFVGLYVWSTYSQPARYSWRYFMELALCIIFALEYLHRLFTEHPDVPSKIRMVTSFRNVIDLLSWAPPLVEFALLPFVPSLPEMMIPLQRLDLRWFKLLRSMRVARIGLLGAELRSLHLSTKRGSWLSAGTNFRLAQLATSVITLLFVATAIFQLLEGMTFHRAFYFTVTTLSTVGSDVVPASFLGRAAVLGMIAVGIVLIPVQAAAFYAEFSARRVVRGALPAVTGRPFILLSARLTEVRAFSDFYSEFRQALSSASSNLPRNARLAVLCNRPSFEFVTFQELHERWITLVEGSAVSAQDLVRVRAEMARAIMLMADRFTADPDAEDLGVLFQVWACKSYTKSAPLFVQTVKQSSVSQIAPFLDPGRDVMISVEAARFRLLALSTVCPGAGTLLGNLLRSSNVLPDRENQEADAKLAGRRWFREYVNGCAYRIVRHTKGLPRHLVGRRFIDVAEWLFRETGLVLMGVTSAKGSVRLNPGTSRLSDLDELLVMAPDEYSVSYALQGSFTRLPDEEKERLENALRSKDVGDVWKGEYLQRDDAVFDGTDCVPVINGNPDSESIDIEDVLCEPIEMPEGSWEGDWDDEGKGAWRDMPNFEDVRSQFVRNSAVSSKSRESNSRSMHSAAAGAAVAEMRSHGHGKDDEDSEDMLRDEPSKNRRQSLSEFSGHIIICGHGGSIVPFLSYLRTAEPDSSVPIVILAPVPPPDMEMVKENFGPIHFVPGSPSEGNALRIAGAASARALVFLARGSRPVKSAQATGSGLEQERGAREAVLADAAALLTCYGAAEESGAALTHAVVELLFTTSVEFLQPGLLLKGNLRKAASTQDASDLMVDELYGYKNATPKPRKSWLLRANMMQAAVEEGLAEWQASPYVAAGRVTVPALLDAYACQCFFSHGLVDNVLKEMSGDVTSFSEEYEYCRMDGDTLDRTSTGEGKGREAGDRRRGALLRQYPLPKKLIGRCYGELFAAMAIVEDCVCLGLYRRKRETIGSRLSYVATNPRWDEVLQPRDRVFVLIPRPS